MLLKLISHKHVLQNTENRNLVSWIFQFIGKLFRLQECHWQRTGCKTALMHPWIPDCDVLRFCFQNSRQSVDNSKILYFLWQHHQTKAMSFKDALKSSIAFLSHLRTFVIVVAAITKSPHLLHHVAKFFWHTFTFQSSASLACYSFAIRLLSCKAPTLHIYATNGTGSSFCFDMVMHGIVNKISKTNFSPRFPLLHEIEFAMGESDSRVLASSRANNNDSMANSWASIVI